MKLIFAWPFSIEQKYIIALQLRGTINANFKISDEKISDKKISDEKISDRYNMKLMFA